MKTLTIVAAAALILFAADSRAGTIPYGPKGTIAPTSTFVATTTGEIDAYFYGFEAADVDFIEVKDLTLGTSSGWFFDNQTTPIGTEHTFLGVNAGDTLEFLGENITTGYTFSSIPTDSADGVNHVYATWYSGTGGPAGIPAGTFIGFEDLYVPPSDLDYNDDQFVLTNVTIEPTPEPSSLLLLGSGLLGLAGFVRRKIHA
jgi:hypothetical protein